MDLSAASVLHGQKPGFVKEHEFFCVLARDFETQRQGVVAWFQIAHWHCAALVVIPPVVDVNRNFDLDISWDPWPCPVLENLAEVDRLRYETAVAAIASVLEKLTDTDTTEPRVLH